MLIIHTNASITECADGIRIWPTIEVGFICRPVPEAQGVIIRIIVVIPRKAPLLSSRSDRENRLVRTPMRVRLLHVVMVCSGSHLHEESITQIPSGCFSYRDLRLTICSYKLARLTV